MSALPAFTADTDKANQLPVWDLTPLYPAPDSPEVTADCQNAADAAATFRSAYTGKIAHANPQTLEEALREYACIEHLLTKLSAYACLYYSENAADKARGAFYQRINEQVSACAEDLVFFTLEINLPEDNLLESAFAASDYLEEHRSWIVRLRKQRPYLLSEAEERTILMKDVTGCRAWQRLFDETLAGLTVRIDGEDAPLQDALHCLQSPKQDVRHTAFAALADALRSNIDTLAYITNTLAKDKAQEYAKRGFTAPIQSRNLDNDIEDDAVEALLQAVEARYPDISHRYYAWKAKRFNVDVLSYADRNAPLPGQSEEPPVSWQDAKDIVLNAYHDFSPVLSEKAEEIFTKNRIHAVPSKGKDSGAFSHPTVPEACPYILMNYKGTQRDIMTLAHELGHGVHQLLCKHHGVLLSNTPLTVAETASVFGEQLTFRALLANANTPQEKERILSGKIEDMINTVVRQTAFCRFEQHVHEARAQGELSADDIAELWKVTQTASLGASVDFPDDARVLWGYISHFIHTPFYVYAYAFGDCLVNSLYRMYTEQPDGFVEKYLELLKAGGSKRYDVLLQPFNLNPRDPSFWNKGLDMISGLMDELEAL